jgi:hypothetical protein
MTHARSSAVLILAAILLGPGSGLLARLAELPQHWSNLVALHRQRGRELQQLERLERSVQAQRLRNAFKDAVVHALFDGRMTLLEAATNFQRLDEECPFGLAALSAYEGRTEVERRCRQIITWARNSPSAMPSERSNAFVLRLEEELARQQSGHRVLEIPQLQ